MTELNCNKLRMQLKDKLENLNVVLFGNQPRVDEVALISTSLDEILIRLIQNSCLTVKQEEELRLLINELNSGIRNQNFKYMSFTKSRINLIL